jgi:alkylhydroperoxidase family enzyme
MTVMPSRRIPYCCCWCTSIDEGTNMAWVTTIPEDAASGSLRQFYARVRERSGTIPNIAKLQSLRPATTAFGFGLYCQLMDDPTGLSKRERVLIATVVSKVNGCLY